MILYGCSGKNLDQFVNKGQMCKDPNENQPSEALKCRDMFFAGWAVGGEVNSFTIAMLRSVAEYSGYLILFQSPL